MTGVSKDTTFGNRLCFRSLLRRRDGGERVPDKGRWGSWPPKEKERQGLHAGITPLAALGGRGGPRLASLSAVIWALRSPLSKPAHSPHRLLSHLALGN